MATCDFEITYSKPTDEAKQIITEEITSNDGDIQITGNSGAFTISVPGGEVTGEVAFHGDTLSVSITEKPGFIPCNIIKSVIEDYLE
ncbi:hypothetical protein [Fodinibius sp.]|uniref:hypothetical protein n=1 Tax=Fodinibius sp. TaxID=1872440 RepID=UPI002ACDEC96|nr:hypothetical protein [Fodinibius sp.]MDZ7660385.1 hypothetical protein [Fodinibius sp.]